MLWYVALGFTSAKICKMSSRFRAGPSVVTRESRRSGSLTDTFTPLPPIDFATPRPARVEIDDGDEGVEEEPSSLMREVLLTSIAEDDGDEGQETFDDDGWSDASLWDVGEDHGEGTKSG